MTSETEIASAEKTDTGARVGTVGSVLGALAMTSCCILPLVLVSFGLRDTHSPHRSSISLRESQTLGK